MGHSHWQYGRFSVSLLIAAATMAGCGKGELAIAPFDAEQAKQYQTAHAERLKTRVELTNKIGMNLRLIPPGKFLMGSPWERGSEINEVPHPVRLTKGFYLSATEVTQQQYQQIVGTNPSYFSADGEGKDLIDSDTGQTPVEQVTWFDAVEFCNRLSDQESLKPYYRREGISVTILGGSGYRLPTEAEWEYACRAGTTTAYHFGNDPAQLVHYAWWDTNSGPRTHSVGKKKSNAFGLYDMHGNVFEWCQDWYASDGGVQLVDDPSGPDKGNSRVFRGGSFFYDAAYLRSACRGMGPPGARVNIIGFRVARSP